jgi:hypothetical protein
MAAEKSPQEQIDFLKHELCVTCKIISLLLVLLGMECRRKRPGVDQVEIDFDRLSALARESVEEEDAEFINLKESIFRGSGLFTKNRPK